MPKTLIKNINKLRFGIEIEVEFPHTKDSYVLIAKHRIIRGWEMDYDGSLDNGAEYRPKEKNRLYYNEDCIDQIKEIIGLIKAHRGNIKPSCGLHIHVDMKNFTNKEICNIIKTFIKKQDTIYRRFKVLKIRQDDSAQKIPVNIKKIVKEKIIQEIKDTGQSSNDNSYFNDRHYGLNLLSLNEHNTLEFRFFNGTIQSKRIKSYLCWVLNFCLNGAKSAK